jgi:hypothetical protein
MLKEVEAGSYLPFLPKEPNKAQAMPRAITHRADARVAPAVTAAYL